MTMYARFFTMADDVREEELTAANLPALLNMAAAMQEQDEDVQAVVVGSNVHYEKIGNKRWTRYSLV